MGDDGVGVSVSVSGILSPAFGCSCEHHAICGENTYLDMVVRFKMTMVEGGAFFVCVVYVWSFYPLFCLTFVSFCLFVGPRGYTSVCGVYWVTEGCNRCMIGRVSEEFKTFFPRLEGRIAQVVTIFPNVGKRRKAVFSKKKKGVCHVMLIDKLIEGDMAMLDLLDLVSDSDD